MFPVQEKRIPLIKYFKSWVCNGLESCEHNASYYQSLRQTKILNVFLTFTYFCH